MSKLKITFPRIDEKMLYETNETAMKLEAEGKRIVKLDIGDPDEPTSPQIIDTALKAMKSGRTKYSSASGEKRLREKLAAIHGVPPDNVIVTTGSKWGAFSTMFLLLKPGDNIVLPSPHWSAYELIARNLGAETRHLRTRLCENWRIDTEKLQLLIDQRTRLLVLNNPNNPNSKVIDERTISEMTQISDDKGIKVLADEVYSDISFVKTKSILDFCASNILIKSFSKTFAMTGWRIGYAIAEKPLIERMTKLNQITLTSVPAFIQDAALTALELKDEIAEKSRQKYQKRADLACDLLTRTNMKFSKPDAPFYLFPKREGLDSERFALDMLHRGVAITPGTAFGDYKEHFRIALTAPDNDIRQGLNTICEALE